MIFWPILYLKVNGDWLSDVGNQVSGSAQSVADTLGSKETWDTVSQAFEGDAMWRSHSFFPFALLYQPLTPTLSLKMLERALERGPTKRGPLLQKESSA